jgi:hypothetical protein
MRTISVQSAPAAALDAARPQRTDGGPEAHHRLGTRVEDSDVVPGTEQARDHVRAHRAEADEAEAALSRHADAVGSSPRSCSSPRDHR